MKFKLFLFILLSAIFGLLLGVLFVEVSVRFVPSVLPLRVQENLYFPNPDGLNRFSPVLLQRNRSLGWKFRPHLDVKVLGPSGIYSLQTIQIRQHNEIGFRDDGVQLPVYAMAVGDSFTEGWSTDQSRNWVELLEQKTRKDWVNMGTRAWSSRPYAQMIKTFFPELHPSVVVWAFFINDFQETGLHNQALLEQSNHPIRSAMVDFLQNRSAIWEMYRLWAKIGPYRVRDETLPIYQYNVESVQLDLGIDRWDKSIDASDPIVQNGIDTTKRLILESHQLVTNQQSNFLLVIIPTAEQVYFPHLKETMSAEDFIKATGRTDFAYLDRAAQILLQFCTLHQIRCLDLTAGFRQAAAQGEQLYLSNDPHWNEAGNQLAAKQIYEYLVDAHLLN